MVNLGLYLRNYSCILVCHVVVTIARHMYLRLNNLPQKKNKVVLTSTVFKWFRDDLSRNFQLHISPDTPVCGERTER